MTKRTLLAMALAGTSLHSQAPGPPQLPADKSIPLALALEAANGALDACTTKKSAVTVEVVDLNGLVKVLLSADGAQTNAFEYSRRKAYTVLHEHMSSGEFGKSLTEPVSHNVPIKGDPNLIQYAGALPIVKNHVLIGAISVSGPTGQEDDEVCAKAGLDRIQARL